MARWSSHRRVYWLALREGPIGSAFDGSEVFSHLSLSQRGFPLRQAVNVQNPDWNDLLTVPPGRDLAFQLFGPPAEVIIDFGPGVGLWVWQNNSTWAKLHGFSASTLVTGDLDGNGQAEVIIDFGPGVGLWVWQNNSTWRQPTRPRLTPSSRATSMAMGKPRSSWTLAPAWGCGCGKTTSTWRQLHTASAHTLVTGDLDSNGQAEVIMDFGPGVGLWVWQNNSTWRQLHTCLGSHPRHGRPR